VVVDEEEREVLLRVLRVLLAVHHGVAEVSVHLLGNHVNELTFLLLLAHVNQKLLGGLRLR